jgi:hypothetical protein
MHHAHRQRDLLAARAFREAVSVPPLEREGQRVSDAGAEIKALDQHVGYFAA